MTTLSAMMYQLALAVAGPVIEGAATGGTMNSLTDDRLDRTPAEFEDGTLWLLSGTYAGRTRRINTHSGDTVTFDPFPTAICQAQVETLTVLGTVTGNGDAAVSLTAAGMNNSPKTLAVAVTNTDTATIVAGKIRTALAADEDIDDFFTIGGSGAIITLTAKRAAANDTTLVMTVQNGTCTGLTLATSTNTTAGIAGPDYAVCADDVPGWLLKQAVNTGLMRLAPYFDQDTTLVTVANQLVYDLPIGVTNDVRQVWIAQRLEDPWDEVRNRYWRPEPGIIRFNTGHGYPLDGYRIRLVYKANHTNLVNDSDEIPWGVNEDALFYHATVHACKIGLRLHKKDDAHQWPDLLNEAQEMLRRNRSKQKNIPRDSPLAG